VQTAEITLYKQCKSTNLDDMTYTKLQTPDQHLLHSANYIRPVMHRLVMSQEEQIFIRILIDPKNLIKQFS